MSALRRMLVRQEIVDVLARYCERLDAADVDGAVALFTSDCITDYPTIHDYPVSGPLVGRVLLNKRISIGQHRFARTHHQLGQVLFEFVSAEQASTIAYATATHRRWDGTFLTSRLQYRDSWVRTAEGWQIRSRRALQAVVEGGPEVESHLVPRQTIDCEK